MLKCSVYFHVFLLQVGSRKARPSLSNNSKSKDMLERADNATDESNVLDDLADDNNPHKINPEHSQMNKNEAVFRKTEPILTLQDDIICQKNQCWNVCGCSL